MCDSVGFSHGYGCSKEQCAIEAKIHRCWYVSMNPMLEFVVGVTGASLAHLPDTGSQIAISRTQSPREQVAATLRTRPLSPSWPLAPSVGGGPWGISAARVHG